MFLSLVLENILLLDYASIAILVILIGTILLKKLYTLTSTKIFVILMFLTLISTIFDIFSVVFFDPKYEPREIYMHVSFAFNCLYYFSRIVTTLVFGIYFYRLTDSIKTLVKSKVYMAFFFSPGLIALILIATNPFHHLIFDIALNEHGNLIYAAGILTPIVYAIVVYYFVLGIINVVRFKYYFNPSQYISLLSIIPLTIIATLFQFLSKQSHLGGNDIILVEMFSTTLSMILITSTIESATELIDPKTTLTSFKQLKKRINKTINEKIKINVFLIDITNFSDIFNKLNSVEADNYIKETCDKLKRKGKSIYCDTYFVDHGLYAVFTNKELKLDKLAQIFIREIKKSGRKEYIPKVKMCIINLPNDFDDVNNILKFMRNFHTKFNFKNEVTYYNDLKNDRDFIITNNIEKILDNALMHNEFIIEYQPIYNIKKQKFTSAEALVRLQTREYDVIEPKYFIEYAEMSGKLIDIDLFVIEEVMYFISKIDFNTLGLETINVNISIVDCLDLSFYDKVKDLLNKYRINPNFINFEIMEGSDSMDHDLICETITKFKNVGINFMLDNYGIGYSNIKNFYKAPLNAVKIDRSLVNNNTSNMNYVLTNTFNIIKSLDRQIFVAGVENEAKVKEFIDYKTDYIQGYYYSKPIAKYEFLEFIKKNNSKEV